MRYVYLENKDGKFDILLVEEDIERAQVAVVIDELHAKLITRMLNAYLNSMLEEQEALRTLEEELNEILDIFY